jgi:hypothetical protein
MQRNHFAASIIDNVQEILNTKHYAGNDSNSKLTKLLSLIDPCGPIRVKSVAFTSSSIPELLHYSFVKNKKLVIDHTLKIIKDKLWKIGDPNISMCEIGAEEELRLYDELKHFTPLSAINGIERLIYVLNPLASCMSSVLADEFVLTLPECL